MSLKTVRAYTKFSHLMRLQSTPEIEQVIRSGFVSIIANAIDEEALICLTNFYGLLGY